MNNLKNIAIMVGTAIVVFLVGAQFLPTPKPQVVQQIIDRNGQTTTRPLGALAGPDIQSPYLGWGAGQVNTWKAGTNFATASSTMCVFEIPPTSTSTIGTIVVIPSSSTTTDRVIFIATSTQAFAPPLSSATASSSYIAWTTVLANAQNGLYWAPPISVGNATGYNWVNSTSTPQTAFVSNPYVAGFMSTTSATYIVVGFKGGGAIDSGVGAATPGSCFITFDNFPQ